jgi:hypothetical protein
MIYSKQNKYNVVGTSVRVKINNSARRPSTLITSLTDYTVNTLFVSRK